MDGRSINWDGTYTTELNTLYYKMKEMSYTKDFTHLGWGPSKLSYPGKIHSIKDEIIKINKLTCEAARFDFPKLDKLFIYRIVNNINPLFFKLIDNQLKEDQLK